MIGVLLNPFGSGVDAYNTDALLAGSDRMLFVSMRALFDPKTPPPQSRQRNSTSKTPVGPLPDPEGLVDKESNDRQPDISPDDVRLLVLPADDQ